MLMEQRQPSTIRARAVQLVLEAPQRGGARAVAIPTVAQRLGISADVLRRWVAEEVPAGPTPLEEDPLTALTRRLHALQQENEILRAASGFFARGLDPQPQR